MNANSTISDLPKIIPVILSGGSGTRLWPLSRQQNPKQFLNFFGDKSLFQEVALRVKNQAFAELIVVCNQEHRFLAASQLQEIGVEAQRIILEPLARNTAPAIAAAAFEAIKNCGDESLILVMPSDHLIEDKVQFSRTVNDATNAAKNGHLITFGVLPERPETGYGYIKKTSTKLPFFTNSSTDFSEIFAVEKFVEKPNQQLAEQLFRDENYFWNSGIFLFSAQTLLQALQQLAPEVFNNVKLAHEKATLDLDFLRLEPKNFVKSPNISIDYAVMEKAGNVAVAPLKNKWCDVGSWDAIAGISERDENQNHLLGDVAALDTSNCYIDSRHQLLATIGLQNLIIIATKDATLVASKDKAQEVKKLFELLKSKDRCECDSSAKTLRPWGSFETVDLGHRFRVKRIIVNPHSALSLQMHKHRAEHWVVVSGEAFVICEDKQFKLGEDQSTYIPLGKKHRLENRTARLLEIVEIQTGDYLGEDDIIRFEDVYGR